MLFSNFCIWALSKYISVVYPICSLQPGYQRNVKSTVLILLYVCETFLARHRRRKRIRKDVNRRWNDRAKRREADRRAAPRPTPPTGCGEFRLQQLAESPQDSTPSSQHKVLLKHALAWEWHKIQMLQLPSDTFLSLIPGHPFLGPS